MEDENKTKAQLIEELTELRKKVSEPAHDRAEHLNRVLRAIRDGNQLIVLEKDRDALISLVKELAGDLGLALHGMQAEGALRLKNQVFEDSIAALSIADTDGIITEVNLAFLKLWGYSSKEDAIGGSVGSFFVNVEDAGPVLEALGSLGRWEGEFLARHADGTTFISHGLATAMKNERGELIGYQSANLDVTEQRRAEEELRKHRDHLEELVEERMKELKGLYGTGKASNEATGPQ